MAGEIMADEIATYAINLEDGTSGPAGKAANALKDLKKQIQGDTTALAELERAFKQLNSAQVVNIQAAQQLRAKIVAKKQAISDAQAAYVGLGGTFGKTVDRGKPVLSLMERLREASKATPGPISNVVSKLGGLRGMLVGGVIAFGIIGIVAALAALVIGAAAATVALFKYGVAQADARRNELLHLEGLTKLRNWYGLAAGSATEMQSAIDRVSASVSIGRDQVAGYTERLYRMGLRGENLSLALEGMSIRAAVLGEASANAFAGMAAGAALAGGSVKKLADETKARLGGIAARQMLSLGVQSKKLQESFAALWSDVNVEPLLKGLKLVTDLFSQNTESGKALKSILERMFQPLINDSETAGLYVRRFFQGMIIGTLLIEQAWLRTRLIFKKVFGKDLFKDLDMTKTAVYAGAAAVGVLAGAVFLTAVAFGALAAAIILPIALIGALAFGIGYLYGEIAKFTVKMVSAAIDLGAGIVRGIVKGINLGVDWVKNALTNLASKAMNAFRSKLGIQSPSKEFAKLGLALPQGVQQGVKTGNAGLDREVRSMVRVPKVAGSDAAPSSAPKGGKSSVSLNIGELHVHSQATDTKAVVRDIREELTNEFELLGLQLGTT